MSWFRGEEDDWSAADEAVMQRAIARDRAEAAGLALGHRVMRALLPDTDAIWHCPAMERLRVLLAGSDEALEAAAGYSAAEVRAEFARLESDLSLDAEDVRYHARILAGGFLESMDLRLFASAGYRGRIPPDAETIPAADALPQHPRGLWIWPRRETYACWVDDQGYCRVAARARA